MNLFGNEYVAPSLPEVKRLRRFNDEDAATLVAIKRLAPLLSEEELKRFDVEIHSPLTMAQQFAAWRARRKAIARGN